MPKDWIFTPKFLTKEMATIAVNAAVKAVLDPQVAIFGNLYDALKPKRKQCHVVVLVPAVENDPHGLIHWTEDYPLKLAVLYDESFLDGEEELEAPFDHIARSKAMQLWNGLNDGRTDIIPHLLFHGYTRYWGGVKREGIVVSCSGVQPWIDRLVSGMVADMLIAMARAAYEASGENENKFDFLK